MNFQFGNSSCLHPQTFNLWWGDMPALFSNYVFFITLFEWSNLPGAILDTFLSPINGKNTKIWIEFLKLNPQSRYCLNFLFLFFVIVLVFFSSSIFGVKIIVFTGSVVAKLKYFFPLHLLGARNAIQELNLLFKNSKSSNCLE